jgi:glycosyltransferase involved in cell wall biosynthesis
MNGGPSLTIVVPTKDERGNVELLVRSMPDFGVPTEILFVDGHSTDGTLDEVRRVAAAHPDRDIAAFTQDGKGKRAAVWQGFERAKGDVLLILDGDVTVPPEELVEAYRLLAASPDVFVNGSRFRWPMERGAMEPINWLGNRVFAWLARRITRAPLTDTLCGTKGLWKRTFLTMRDTAFLRGIDRYGDQELIFGAWNLGCQLVEVPFHYRARVHGEPKIAKQKLRGGWAFLRICLAALWAKCTGRAPAVHRSPPAGNRSSTGR